MALIEYYANLLLFHKTIKILIQIGYCEEKQLALSPIKNLWTIVMLVLTVVIKTNKDYFEYDALFEMRSIYCQLF